MESIFLFFLDFVVVQSSGLYIEIDATYTSKSLILK